MSETEGTEKASTPENPPRPERSVDVRGETRPGGRAVPYRATAGTLNLKGGDDGDRASIFYVSYVAEGTDDPQARPVTFCFNGGPGSSSVWLQFGAIGPQRVDLPDGVAAPPPPYRVVDNEEGLLDRTDLVFVDPVGTGFSRTQGDARGKDFHGIDEDIASVAEFVSRWLSRNGRWNSPRYLLGESYGTTRAAGLARNLQDRGVAFNGLLLVSLALDFQTFIFEVGNDLPHALYLPTYAATAWYHGRLSARPADRDAWLAEVRRFALEEYAPALLQGAALPDEARTRLAARLAGMTGLPADEIARRDLRIEYLWFARQVLGGDGRTVGRLDSRHAAPDSARHAERTERDPSYDAMLAAFCAVANDQLRRVLGWETDDVYEVLSEPVHESWRWSRGPRMGYPNVTDDLRRAMIANPHLRVLFLNGIFDLATPSFAAEYTAAHLGLEPGLADRIALRFYEAGHMMYLHPPSREKLRADLLAFYDAG